MGKGRHEEAPGYGHKDGMEHMVLMDTNDSSSISERLTAEWVEAKRMEEERVDAEEDGKESSRTNGWGGNREGSGWPCRRQ